MITNPCSLLNKKLVAWHWCWWLVGTCFSYSRQSAARVVTMHGILCIKLPLLSTSLKLIFATLHINLSLLVKKCMLSLSGIIIQILLFPIKSRRTPHDSYKQHYSIYTCPTRIASITRTSTIMNTQDPQYMTNSIPSKMLHPDLCHFTGVCDNKPVHGTTFVPCINS